MIKDELLAGNGCVCVLRMVNEQRRLVWEYQSTKVGLWLGMAVCSQGKTSRGEKKGRRGELYENHQTPTQENIREPFLPFYLSFADY